MINVDHGYTCAIEDFEFVPGSLEACAALSARGYTLVVVTNQSGIGRGLYAQADFERLTDWMRERFAQSGAPLAAVYHCPDHPTAGLGPYRKENSWRKPGPGMMLQAARDLDLDLTQSWCVGDKPSDIEAAVMAGVGIRVLYQPDGKADCTGDPWRISGLRDMPDLLSRQCHHVP